jgi:16S rRNA (guanine527-N7)-methyltransferase
VGTTTDAPRQEVTAPAAERAASAVGWPGLALAAARVGVPLGDDRIALFDAYRRLLLERNARTNLTAIRDPEEVERRLFLDALLMIPTVDRLRAALPGKRHRLIDVGSGAGFPGLAIKIVRPDLDVTLVEAMGKKAAFLIDAIAALGLAGVSAVHARAEELGHDPAHRDGYDLATARAVASLPALLELCSPLLRVGGSALFPKGAAIDDELRAARRAAALLGVRVGGVEVSAEGTRLVRVDKVGKTPGRYPRRSGIPARDPLGAASGERRPEADGSGRSAR